MSKSTIACLLVTHLPVKAERQRYPALRGKPLVIIESYGPDEMVLDSSSEARGVAAGMPLPEALAQCPGAMLLPSDQRFYSDTFDRLADTLAMRCPVVEKAEMGCVYAGLEGLDPIYGGEARLIASLLQCAPPDFGSRVGVASGKFPAYVSAATARPGRAVKTPPDAAAFLNGHSIELLPLSQKSKERLWHAGIYTLGQLAALTVGAAQSHLGSEGRHAWDMAHGIDPNPMPTLSRAAA